MRLWLLPNLLILELDSVDLELTFYLDPFGIPVAEWVDSRTGRAIAAVPVVEA